MTTWRRTRRSEVCIFTGNWQEPSLSIAVTCVSLVAIHSVLTTERTRPVVLPYCVGGKKIVFGCVCFIQCPFGNLYSMGVPMFGIRPGILHVASLFPCHSRSDTHFFRTV